MKKYLLIVLTTFVTIWAVEYAEAAKMTGTVPIIPPLQPAPEGVKPNLSGSVDFGKKTFDAPPSQETGQEPVSKQAVSPQPQLVQKSQYKAIIFFSLVSGALIASAWWFYRREKAALPTKK